MNICSYHLQEAGATPVQEIGVTLTNAFAVPDRVEQCPGISTLAVEAPISFFVNGLGHREHFEHEARRAFRLPRRETEGFDLHCLAKAHARSVQTSSRCASTSTMCGRRLSHRSMSAPWAKMRSTIRAASTSKIAPRNLAGCAAVPYGKAIAMQDII